MKDLQEYYTVKELADMIGVTKPIIMKLIKRQGMRIERDGDKILIPGREIYLLMKRLEEVPDETAVENIDEN